MFNLMLTSVDCLNGEILDNVLNLMDLTELRHCSSPGTRALALDKETARS